MKFWSAKKIIVFEKWWLSDSIRLFFLNCVIWPFRSRNLMFDQLFWMSSKKQKVPIEGVPEILFWAVLVDLSGQKSKLLFSAILASLPLVYFYIFSFYILPFLSWSRKVGIKGLSIVFDPIRLNTLNISYFISLHYTSANKKVTSSQKTSLLTSLHTPESLRVVCSFSLFRPFYGGGLHACRAERNENKKRTHLVPEPKHFTPSLKASLLCVWNLKFTM